MKILGISTGTKQLSAGVVENGNVLCEFTCSVQRSEELVVYLEKIFEGSGISMKEIGAVAVTAGPGSYSGLRGGLAAAKAIAQSMDIPIAGISTLEAMAYNLKNVRGTIAVILDAVRNEHNIALFSSDGKSLKRLMEDTAIEDARVREFLSGIKGELYLISTVGIEHTGNNIVICDPFCASARGSNVAFIGEKKIESGKRDDPERISPDYSHMPKLKEYKK